MPKKLMRCVKKVKEKGGTAAKGAYPICIKATGQKPHSKKSSQGGRRSKY